MKVIERLHKKLGYDALDRMEICITGKDIIPFIQSINVDSVSFISFKALMEDLAKSAKKHEGSLVRQLLDRQVILLKLVVMDIAILFRKSAITIDEARSMQEMLFSPDPEVFNLVRQMVKTKIEEFKPA